MMGTDWEVQRLALESYQQAVKLDPGFALAHAWVATAHHRMAYGYDLSLPTGVTGAQRFELARQAAEHALALDPDLPRAHSVLADNYRLAGDTTRSWRSSAAPCAVTPATRSQLLTADGPSFTVGSGMKGFTAWNEPWRSTLETQGAYSMSPSRSSYTHDYQTAEEYFDRAMTVSPDAPLSHLSKVWINLIQGRVERARAAMREGVRQVGVSKLLFQVSLATPWLPHFPDPG